MIAGIPLVVCLLLTAGAVAPAVAQVEVTVTPTMTRGPANAPVTIVEFFDFE
jgi:protein-disulfide isomerase